MGGSNENEHEHGLTSSDQSDIEGYTSNESTSQLERNDTTPEVDTTESSGSEGREISRRDFIKQLGIGAGVAATAPLALGKGFSPNRVYAQTSDPVRVGVLLPYSGIAATTGESIHDAMELYFDQIDWRAGGRDIEIIQQDTELDPGLALTRARRLIEQHQVDMLTGVVSSGVLLALRDYVEANQTLLLCSNAGANALSRDMKSPYVWRTSTTSWQYSHPIGYWAAENLGKRGMISIFDYAAGHEIRDAIAYGYVQEGGEILDVQAVSFPDMGDPAPYMSAIEDVDPDVVMGFIGGSGAVSFVNAYDEFGLQGEIPMAVSGLQTAEMLLPGMGSSADGIVSGMHYAWGLDTPENNEFKNRFEEHSSHPPNVFAVQGFDTARLIAEMLDELGGDTSSTDNMIDVLPGISFPSPRGPFTLDEETQNPEQNVYIREVREGEDGNYHNYVLENVGLVVDAGDDSMELTP